MFLAKIRGCPRDLGPSVWIYQFIYNIVKVSYQAGLDFANLRCFSREMIPSARLRRPQAGAKSDREIYI